MKGKKPSKEKSEKHSEYMKELYKSGKIKPWNKGKIGVMPIPWNKGLKGFITSGSFKKGHPCFLNENSRRLISEKNKISKLGDNNPAKKPEVREKIRNTLKNKYKNGEIKLQGIFLKSKLGLIKKENHPRWLGGKSFEPYTLDFNIKFKNEIRQRDNQICINCGIHREKLKRALNIHHINYDKGLSIPENCISLCDKCHGLTTSNREYWTKLFQEKLTKLYNYQYSEDRKVILNFENINNVQ